MKELKKKKYAGEIERMHDDQMVFDDPPSHEVLLNDPLEHRRITCAVPGALGVDDRVGPLEAGPETFAAGDRDAIQDCMKAYGGLVWSLARRMLNDPEEAEDIVQGIFVDVWKNAERFDPNRASETTFVAMIARRRIIDKVRYGANNPKGNLPF